MCLDAKAGVVKKKKKIRKSYDAQGHSLQPVVHSYTQSKTGTQTNDSKHTGESDRKQDKQTSAAGCEVYQGHLFLSCHSKAATLFVPSGETHFCTCVRGTCKETSHYTAYYIAIKRRTDKRACFKTGNAVKTYSHADGKAGSRFTERNAERQSETQADCQ